MFSSVSKDALAAVWNVDGRGQVCVHTGMELKEPLCHLEERSLILGLSFLMPK